MKVAILGDLHIGIRNSNKFFISQHKDFFENQFFPYLKEHNIDTVIQAGDSLDSRKFIHIDTLRAYKELFLNHFTNDISLHMILGNHCIYHTNQSELSLVKELSKEYSDNIHLYDEYSTVNFDNTTFDFCPWINKTNKDDYLAKIKGSCSEFIVGHFEIKKMEMAHGIECTEGLSFADLKGFKTVFSGHFHNDNFKRNIQYLTTPIQLDWGDYGTNKGFWVFDTETKSYEFIKNNNNIYHRIVYDDTVNKYDKIDDLSGFVKLIIIKKNDELMFDRYYEALSKQEGIQDIQIINNDVLLTDVDVSEFETKNNMDVILDFIDGYDTKLNKDNLKQHIISIYNESIIA